MQINTKSNPSPKVYARQFQELLGLDKLSYGIVSTGKPDVPGSPLWVDTMSLKASIYLSGLPRYYSYIARQDESEFGSEVRISSSTGDYMTIGTGPADERYFHFDFVYTRSTEFSRDYIANGVPTQVDLGNNDVVDLSVKANGENLLWVDNAQSVTRPGLWFCDFVEGKLWYCAESGSSVEIKFKAMLGDRDATIASLDEALVAASDAGTGIKASLYKGVITIVGVADFGISSSSTPYLSIEASSRVVVYPGSCVMPVSHDIVRVEKDCILNVPVNGVNGKILFVVLREKLEVDETGKDVFGKDCIKSLKIADGSRSIEIVESFDESENCVCLGVIRPYTPNIAEAKSGAASSVIKIDSKNETYHNVRPWYSVSDVDHASERGTGKVTENNPHGISYNDLYTKGSDTLHNTLTDRGMLLSKPTEVVDVCGIRKRVSITRLEVMIDETGAITGKVGDGVYYGRYYELPDIPLSVVSMRSLADGSVVPYRWVENTSYIEVPHGTRVTDFYVEYFYEPSLSPVVGDNGTDVDISGVSGNCVLFSEGRSLEATETNVSFKKAVPNKEYFVYIDGNGNLVKTPSLSANVDLVESSGNLENPRTRSRLEVVLDNIPGTSPLKCPTSPVLISGSCGEEIEVYQTFVVVKQNKNGTKIYSKESSISKGSVRPPVVEGSDNRMILECEKPVQEHVESYSYRKKPHQSITKYAYNNDSMFVVDEGDVILGGIDVAITLSEIPDNTDLAVVLMRFNESGAYADQVYLMSWNDIEGEEAHRSDPAELGGRAKLLLHTDRYDGRTSAGNWTVHISSKNSAGRSIMLDELQVTFNYGVIEPRLYAKLADGTYKTLPHIKLDTGRYEVDLDTGSPSTPTNYDDFLTKITLVGHANGSEVTEELVFGPDFRNQSGMNSKMSVNTFDTIDKFNITETATGGSVTMLAHPVGNVDNMCSLFSAFYGETRLNKIIDRRCVRVSLPDRDRSILYEGADFTEKLSRFCEDNRLRPYFSLENVCDEPIVVTIRTGTSAVAYLNNELTTMNVGAGPEGTDVTLLPGEHVRLDGSTPIGNPGVPLIEVSGSSSAKVAIRHFDTTWTSLRYAFADCDELVSIPDSWEGLENVTDMSGAFSGCRNLRSIPSSWEGLEKVTSMVETFFDCASITSIPSSWKFLDSLADMDWTFIGTGIQAIPSWEGLDALRTMCSAFASCKNLETIPLSWAGLEKVYHIGGIFSYCSSLKAIPEYWSGLQDVSVADVAFLDCPSLRSVPISWAGLEKLEEARGMFSGCSSITEIPKSWKGLPKLKNAEAMFKDCSSLSEGGSRDVTTLSSVTNVKEMLYRCVSLTESVDYLYEFFSSYNGNEVNEHRNFCSYDEQATGWDRIPIAWGGGNLGSDDNYVVLENTAGSNMAITLWSNTDCTIYRNSEAVDDIPSGNAIDITLEPGDVITAWDLTCCGTVGMPVVAWISGAKEGLAVRKWNSHETTLDYAFEGCTCLSSIPDSWDGCRNVTSARYAFKGCTSLPRIPDSWSGLEKATDLTHAFDGDISLSSIPERWSGLGLAANVDYMFYCSGVTAIPKSFTGLDSITAMRHMFEGCLSLVEMNGSWEGCESVESIEGLYKGCTSIRSGGGTSIVSLSAVKNCTDAFYGCSKWSGSAAYSLYVLLSKPSGSGTSTRASSHANCFFECSSAESYEKIPGDWGGNYPTDDEKFVVLSAKKDTGAFKVKSNDPGLMAYVNGVSKQATAEGGVYVLTLDLTKGVSANIYKVDPSTGGPIVTEGNPGSLSISRWPAGTAVADNMFKGCTALGSVDAWEGLEDVVSMESTFENCTSLSSVNWNFSTMSKLENLSKAFKGCSNLSFSISSWGGLGNIYDMSQAFEGTKIGSFPASWTGLSKVTNLYRTFANCKSLRTGGCDNLETLPKGVDMTGMLLGCSNYAENIFMMSARIKELELDGNGCFSGCTNADGYKLAPAEYGGAGEPYMEVVNCSGRNGYIRVCSMQTATLYLNGVKIMDTEPLGDSGKQSRLMNIYKDDTLQITGLKPGKTVKCCVDMFTDTSKKVNLVGLEISKWDSSIETYDYAFDNCGSLTKIRTWEGLENATDLMYGFYKCTKLESIPETWDNLSEMIAMNYAFYGCVRLGTIPETWSGLYNLSDISGTFGECTKLKRIPESWSGLENVSRAAETFQNCTSLSGGVQDGSSFGDKGTFYDCHKMFYGCRSYNVSVELARRLDELLKARYSDYTKDSQGTTYHNRVFGAFYKILNETEINGTGLFAKTWFSAT